MNDLCARKGKTSRSPMDSSRRSAPLALDEKKGLRGKRRCIGQANKNQQPHGTPTTPRSKIEHNSISLYRSSAIVARERQGAIITQGYGPCLVLP